MILFNNYYDILMFVILIFAQILLILEFSFESNFESERE